MAFLRRCIWLEAESIASPQRPETESNSTFSNKKSERRHDRSFRCNLRIEEMQIMPLAAWLPCSDVREIGTGPHRPHQMRLIENIIARNGSASSPVPRNICSEIGATNLLAVAVDAAFRYVDLSAQIS